jgi:hypothetical protein
MPGKTNLPRAQDYLQWWHCPTPAAGCRWRRRLRRALPPTSFLVLQQRPLQPRDAAQNEHIEASNQHSRGEIPKFFAELEHLSSQEGGGSGGIQPRSDGRSCALRFRSEATGGSNGSQEPLPNRRLCSLPPAPCPWLAIE